MNVRKPVMNIIPRTIRHIPIPMIRFLIVCAIGIPLATLYTGIFFLGAAVLTVLYLFGIDLASKVIDRYPWILFKPATLNHPVYDQNHPAYEEGHRERLTSPFDPFWNDLWGSISSTNMIYPRT